MTTAPCLPALPLAWSGGPGTQTAPAPAERLRMPAFRLAVQGVVVPAGGAVSAAANHAQPTKVQFPGVPPRAAPA